MLLLIALVGSVISSALAATCSQYGEVNNFIGSGGFGYGYGGINPGANSPYGVLRVGPDTTSSIADITFRHFSGYNFLDNSIRGFSHTHLVGAGVNDLGTFGLMPVKLNRNQEDISKGKYNIPKPNGWWSSFDKNNEHASPGYYKVHLDDPNVDVELLSISGRAAIHRYTYQPTAVRGEEGGAAGGAGDPLAMFGEGFVLDVCHSAKLEHANDDSPCKVASLSVLPATAAAAGEGKGNQPAVVSFEAAVQFQGGLSGLTWYYLHGEISFPNHPKAAAASIDSWTTCTARRGKAAAEDEAAACSSVSASQGLAQTNSTTGTLFTIAHITRSPLAASTSSSTSSSTAASPLVVEVRVGLSHISPAFAANHLHDAVTGSPGSSFDELLERTQATWCTALSSLQVTPIPGDEDLLPILHSAHYRSLFAVTDYTEYGLYYGLDHALHNATAERQAAYPASSTAASPTSSDSRQWQFISDLSLWDTFRTLQPWLLLVDEDLSVAIARSMTEMTTQQQAFPRWVLGGHEASCMIGESGVSFLVDCLLAGLGAEFDSRAVQKIFLAQSTGAWPVNGRTDIDHYLAAGYVSSETSDSSASLTLTFAYDDFLLGKLSELVGDSQAATQAYARSKNYQTLWSADQKVFCPRSVNGTLQCSRRPTDYKAWMGYVEGDALHWSWFVPHDVPGLMALYPSPQAFNDQLQTFLQQHLVYHNLYGAVAPNPYFWNGNEHDLQAPFFFNYPGADCTNNQYWIRQLTHLHFKNAANGLPGNDDYGSMSTWLLFASLGLYPQPGMAAFFITSPRVMNATVQLTHWKAAASTLTIATFNNSQANVYIDRLVINGVTWTSPFIDRAVLSQPGGVTLAFYMTNEKRSGLCPATKKK